MHMQGTARVVALGSALILATLSIASCSSDEEAPAPSASATAAAPSASALAPSASATPTGAAAAACAAYFELDLLNSAYAGGAVADGDYTEQQIREDFQASLKELVAEAKLAIEDGSADPKLLANAKRMKKLINTLGKEQALSELPKAKQTRFAKSSLRVQKACDRAGYPLPADNVTARTAAGI